MTKEGPIEDGAMIAHPGKCTQLPALTVVEKQRFRSSLTVANLFTVRTVFRIIGQAEVDGAMIAHPGKCTQLPARTVVEKQRFRSSLMEANLFTVRTATRNTGRKDN